MSIYDNILSQLENEPLHDVVAEIRNIPEVPETQHRARDQNDLIEYAAEFTRPLIESSTGTFSPPVPTTITINGQLNGVDMMEETLIKYVDIEQSLACVECNFGHKMTPEYRLIYEEECKRREDKAKLKVTKKKPGQQERKVQGDGTCFASQLTFIDRKYVPAYCDGDTVEDYEVRKFFKIKVFRNGVLQIPGGKPGLLRYIMQSLEMICGILTRVFNSREYVTRDLEAIPGHGNVQPDAPHDGGDPPPRPTADELMAAHTPVKVSVAKLLPVMIDYKFHCELQEGDMIDLTTLLLIFTMEKLRQDNSLFVAGGALNIPAINSEMDGFDYEDQAYALLDVMRDIPKRQHPDILDIKYSKTETKLSIMFHTPLLHKSAKKVRVNIFLGGWIDDGLYGAKIDILGALYRETTLAIYYFLMDTFERYWDYIVINPLNIEPEYAVVPRLPDNVALEYDAYSEQLERPPAPKPVIDPSMANIDLESVLNG